MAAEPEWIPIIEYGRAIGEVGLISGKVAIVASYSDFRDLNKDGRVGPKEGWIAEKLPKILQNNNMYLVTRAAIYQQNIRERDADFGLEEARNWDKTGKSYVATGIGVYLLVGRHVVGQSIARAFTRSRVKQLVIRYGFEHAVEASLKR